MRISEQIETVSLGALRVAPENESLYRNEKTDSDDFQLLVKSIRENGLHDPLIVSLDNVILSGHRRRLALEWAGAHVANIRRADVSFSDLSQNDRLRVLRDFNHQRVKSPQERINERLVDIDRTTAYQRLRESREQAAQAETAISLKGAINRCEISQRKMAMLEKAIEVIDSLGDYWPVSLRTVHYQLLNDPPLRNTSSGERYQNNTQSYKDLSNLLTRARISGIIPQECIDDETRPTTRWRTHSSVDHYVADCLTDMMQRYQRDLLQSQEHHVEIIAEKLTVKTLVDRVASRYTMPVTISRGEISLPPRQAIIDRWKSSQKNQLRLIVLADLDPSGWSLRQTAARSIIHDLGVPKDRVKVFSAAVNKPQIGELGLQPNMEAKRTDKKFAAFFRELQLNDAYELESIAPKSLEEILDNTIRSVIDVDQFNKECEKEADEAAVLEAKFRYIKDELFFA